MEELTIGKLIAHLTKFPMDMLVGAVGYYGEFYPMTEFNFSKSPTHVEGSKPRLYFNALAISAPDVGPEPD